MSENRKSKRPPLRRANDLDGREWTRNSISVWSDIRKTPEETALKHPAMFPSMLVERIIRSLTNDEQRTVLDPFCGSGSTLVAAVRLGKQAVGLDVSAEYAELARARLAATPGGENARVFQMSSTQLLDVLAPESIDLCVTSPPYWNILARNRTADRRTVRDYEGGDDDLSDEADYRGFLDRLTEIFRSVFVVLRPGAYCVVNVMDLRKRSRFFPLHSDLIGTLTEEGLFILDDLIVWDRHSEYNFLRPLGYPAVFRINKVHEFLLLFQKPRAGSEAGRSPR